MAHGVLHRAQQQVRACPQTGPLPCSCASPVLRDSTAQGCRGRRMGSSPPAAAAPHRDTAPRPGQPCEDAAMCTAAVPLWTPAPPQRGWRIYVSVLTALEAVKPFVLRWPASFSQAAKTRAASLASATAARTRAVFPSFRTDPASAATRTLHMSAAGLPHTRAAVPLAPGTQGGQRADPTRRRCITAGALKEHASRPHRVA